MSSIEQVPRSEAEPDFGMEFDVAGFDINAAFQGAIADVGADKELELDEKVRRMERIVQEGVSETYRDFVDFRAMAAQMEMMCMHDHALDRSMQSNVTLSSLMDGHDSNDGHDHEKHDHEDEGYEIDPKTGKKTKKKKHYDWFSLLLQ